MKIIVVKPDSKIRIDDIPVMGCEMESNDFWAFNYDTETGGEIEFTDRNEPLNSESDIADKTGVSLSEWQSRQALRIAELQAEENG